MVSRHIATENRDKVCDMFPAIFATLIVNLLFNEYPKKNGSRSIHLLKTVDLLAHEVLEAIILRTY